MKVRLKYFRNQRDLEQFNEQQLKKLNVRANEKLYNSYFGKTLTQSYVESEPEFFGTSSLEELKSEITRFAYLPLLYEVLDKLKTTAEGVSFTSSLEKKQIRFNDAGRGIFSFDLASTGLQHKTEYRDVETMELVDANLVDRMLTGPEQYKYYNRDNGREALLEKKKNADGKYEYRTTNKKVFVEIANRDADQRTVDLYITAGGAASVTAKQMLYRGIAGILLAEKLEQVGVRVKIYVMDAHINFEDDNFYGAVVAIKNYGDPVDYNMLALLSSDARVFRYKGFITKITITDFFNVELDDGFGRSTFSREQLDAVLNHIDEEQQKKVESGEAKARANFIFGAGIQSEKDVLDEYTRTLEQIKKRFT